MLYDYSYNCGRYGILNNYFKSYPRYYPLQGFHRFERTFHLHITMQGDYLVNRLSLCLHQINVKFLVLILRTIRIRCLLLHPYLRALPLLRVYVNLFLVFRCIRKIHLDIKSLTPSYKRRLFFNHGYLIASSHTFSI